MLPTDASNFQAPYTALLLQHTPIDRESTFLLSCKNSRRGKHTRSQFEPFPEADQTVMFSVGVHLIHAGTEIHQSKRNRAMVLHVEAVAAFQ